MINVLGHKLFPVSFAKKACFVIEGSYNPTGGVKGGLCYLRFTRVAQGVFQVNVKNVIRNTVLSPTLNDGDLDFDYSKIIAVQASILFNAATISEAETEVYSYVGVDKITLYIVNKTNGLVDPLSGSYLQCRVFSYF